jgi:alpha-methylacyl-CoA racemase
MKERLAAIFRTKTRDEWTAVFEGTDACVSPILSMTEAPKHPYNTARNVYVTDDAGIVQPAPAPRFSRTTVGLSRAPAMPGEHTDEVLAEAGLSESEIAKLREAGAVA